MKHKVGTVLDDAVYRRAKRRALEERKPLSAVIQEALERYLAARPAGNEHAQAAYRLFCERPIRINRRQFDVVVRADVWSR